MTQFRKGDIVTIKCVVQSYFRDNDLRVLHPDGYTDIFITADKVTTIRHALEVGDLVLNTGLDGQISGSVRAVYDNVVWIENINGFYTWDVEDCVRVEREKAQVVA